MSDQAALRKHLLYLLNGDGAHLNLEEAIKNLPAARRGERPAGSPYSAWEVLEHLRIAQLDVLESLRKANHVSPEFPAGYWPKTPAPPSAKAWEQTAAAIRADLEELKGIVENEANDLLAKVGNHEDQTIMRKLLMAADHNAYHLGQLVLLGRLLQ